MFTEFLNAAEYCDQAYGSAIIAEDGVTVAFICPHCDEPIYFEDWDGEPETGNWMVFPVCGEEWSDDQYERLGDRTKMSPKRVG